MLHKSNIPYSGVCDGTNEFRFAVAGAGIKRRGVSRVNNGTNVAGFDGAK